MAKVHFGATKPWAFGIAAVRGHHRFDAVQSVEMEDPQTSKQTVRANVSAVFAEISAACDRSGRDPASVTLLPVTKYVDVESVRWIAAAGLHAVGESTIQETLRKRSSLASEDDLQWHLIGHLQRNKVARALKLYTVIHSLDSLRLAESIERRRNTGASLPDLYVEVNISGEETKSGLRSEDTLGFIRRLKADTGLGPSLAGLMTVAPYSREAEVARPYFRRLRELRDEAVRADLLPRDAGLSMGMSNDFVVAVEEGATVLRIGSRLFDGLPGTRKNSQPSEHS